MNNPPKPEPSVAKNIIKALLIGGGVLFLLIILVGIFVDAPPTTPSAPVEVETEPVTDAPVVPEIIPGLAPVDVYLSLEQRGFIVEKDLQTGACSWVCTQEWPSVKFTADVFGPDVNSVSSVRADVMADGVNKTALAGRDFLAMVASVPYTGAEQQASHDWVIANYDTDSATMVVGGAQFILRAPSELYRMLIIGPVR